MELRIHVVTMLSTLIHCSKCGSSVLGLAESLLDAEAPIQVVIASQRYIPKPSQDGQNNEAATARIMGFPRISAIANRSAIKVQREKNSEVYAETFK
ncbi:UNVERIFIED_CONTAM: hypothetical protein Sindi_0493100 [Sesamum indicum]